MMFISLLASTFTMQNGTHLSSNLSTVRGISSADTVQSFPSLVLVPVFPNPHVTQVPRTTTVLVGTPSAVGAIRVNRKSHTLSLFKTYAPIRRSPLALQGSRTSKNTNTTHANHDSDNSPDPEQVEFAMEDARLVLEVAKARRVVCQIEQDLAKAKNEETLVLCNLYKYRAEEAGKRLEEAEYDIGHVRNSLRNTGIPFH
ncbi:hypothetical protein V8E55_005249 [Tylopilus felleus]